MATTDEDKSLELACAQLGVERARSGYGASRKKHQRGTLVLTPSHLALFDSDGRESQRFERASVARGWFAPGFAYEPIDLPMLESGGEGYARYEPQLILELQSKQWIVASVEREDAYALLDVLSIGPRQGEMSARLFLPSSPPWMRDGAVALSTTGLLGGLIGWFVPSVVVTFFLLLLSSSSAPQFSSFATLVVVVWLSIVAVRWLLGFVVVKASRSELVLPERAHALPLAIESIERVEYNNYGATLFARHGERPIVAEIRAYSGTIAISDEVYTDVVRLGHAVIDWALATAELRAKHRALIEAAINALPSGEGPARMEASKALLLGDGYRVAPADERALVALATDVDSAPTDRACAAAAIVASGSAESRARVLVFSKK
ncbi:MAG: hypothetical protein JNK05_05670 [Myxococcales bacterium]|nr:hypothetical protein [Myxococcales bacterium]